MIRTLGNLLAFAAASLAAAPAVALSCLRPDVAQSYKAASEAAEAYIVVHGQLQHDKVSVPERTQEGGAPETFEARLVGSYLNGADFSGAFDAPVTVTLNCAVVWCAPLPPQDSDILAFVQKTESGYLIDAQPCQQWLFTAPTAAQIEQITSCHAGGDCTPLN